MEKISFRFSKHNFIFLCICLTGLLMLVVFALMPLKKEDQALKSEIPMLNAKLNQQKELREIIANIDKMVEKSSQRKGPPIISLTPLSKEKTHLIVSEVKDIAQRANIKIFNIEPLIDKKDKDWHNLIISTEMQGNFSDLRSFLFDLLSLPYVDNISRIEIHSSEGTLIFDLTFSVNLS